MLIFDFPYHKVRTEYPDSTTRIQMGKSWMFPIAPESPDQRLFILTFKGMKYFTVDGVISEVVNPQRNMATLDKFYRNVLMWDEFNYVHNVYGPLVCRFNQPLKIPEGIEDGDGQVDQFEVTLLEVPQ